MFLLYKIKFSKQNKKKNTHTHTNVRRQNAANFVKSIHTQTDKNTKIKRLYIYIFIRETGCEHYIYIYVHRRVSLEKMFIYLSRCVSQHITRQFQDGRYFLSMLPFEVVLVLVLVVVIDFLHKHFLNILVVEFFHLNLYNGNTLFLEMVFEILD